MSRTTNSSRCSAAQVQDQFDVVLQRMNRVAQKRIRRSFKV